MSKRKVVLAMGKEKLRVLAMLCVQVICLQQMAFAKELTDAEIAKKLQLKPGTEIIRKNGKRYLVTPLSDEDIEQMVHMSEKLEKMMAGVPKPDPIHDSSQKTYWKGRRLMESGKTGEAIPLFSDYITQFKKESATTKKENQTEHDYYLSWGYQNRGYCYLHDKKYPEGVADLSDAIKLRPNYAMNYINRAKAYRLMGNIKLAQADDAKIMSLPKLTGATTADLQKEFPATKGGAAGGGDGSAAASTAVPSKAK
jgi:tetratricopeptide (TPR) repeat protein